MSAATTKPKLICAECRYENEAERIYCHNCGERLDRSSIIAQKKVDNSEEIHRRLQKLLRGPSRTRRNFFTACKLALAAAATAVLVQLLLPPEFPEPVKSPSMKQMDLELESAIQKSVTLTYSEQEVNAYLAYRLTSKKKMLNKPFLNFERAAVVLKEGVGTIGWERSIFGYPIYSLISYRAELNGGKINLVTTGGWIGRMPIHPSLMRYTDIIFKDLWTALDRDRKLVAKMNTVEFHDGSITLIPQFH